MLSSFDFHGCSVPDKPTLSLVTPSFNGVGFLAKALRSVEILADTVSLEHVVADGGSTDGTREMLACAPYVRGVSRKDKGLYDALNWAISQSRGDFVQWLNADDELPNQGFVERAILLLQADPKLDFVLGSTCFIDTDDKERERWCYDSRIVTDFDMQAKGCFFNVNSMLLRRKTVVEVGPFDQARFPIGADRDFQLRLLLRHRNVACLSVPAYRFRINPLSLTSGIGAQIRCLEETATVFKKWSRVEQLPKATRRRFAIRSEELLFGLGLKHLKSPRSIPRGLAMLSARMLGHPTLMRHAVGAWLSHRLVGDIHPTGNRATSRVKGQNSQ